MNTRDRMHRITIASPCQADWEAMKGDARSRFCGACTQTVYNFSEMHADEIEALLATQERVCGRLYRRRDGTIVTRDCSWVWAEANVQARSLLGAHAGAFMAVLGAVCVLLLVSLGVVAVFGDNIRKLLGASAGGVTHSPPPPPRSATPITTFGEHNSY